MAQAFCDESIFLSRVEGSMSRVEGNIFFPNLFFEKVIIIDAINVINTNK